MGEYRRDWPRESPSTAGRFECCERSLANFFMLMVRPRSIAIWAKPRFRIARRPEALLRRERGIHNSKFVMDCNDLASFNQVEFLGRLAASAPVQLRKHKDQVDGKLVLGAASPLRRKPSPVSKLAGIGRAAEDRVEFCLLDLLPAGTVASRSCGRTVSASSAEELVVATPILQCWLCSPPLSILHLQFWIDLLTNTN